MPTLKDDFEYEICNALGTMPSDLMDIATDGCMYAASRAMQSQAISFSTWKDREYLLSGGITTDGEKLYRHKHALNGKRSTLDALYTLFLTSQPHHP